jgi:hypothetical protein
MKLITLCLLAALLAGTSGAIAQTVEPPAVPPSQLPVPVQGLESIFLPPPNPLFVGALNLGPLLVPAATFLGVTQIIQLSRDTAATVNTPN